MIHENGDPADFLGAFFRELLRFGIPALFSVVGILSGVGIVVYSTSLLDRNHDALREGFLAGLLIPLGMLIGGFIAYRDARRREALLLRKTWLPNREALISSLHDYQRALWDEIEAQWRKEHGGGDPQAHRASVDRQVAARTEFQRQYRIAAPDAIAKERFIAFENSVEMAIPFADVSHVERTKVWRRVNTECEALLAWMNDPRTSAPVHPPLGEQ